MLIAVAPHLGAHHSTDRFFQELVRLLKRSPKEVIEVLDTAIESSEVDFNYSDNLKNIVNELAELDERPAALRFCERLRDVPGMRELFDRLVSRQ